MMITLAWGIIKTFGPYLLIAALLSGVYFAGGYAVQRKWDSREAQVKAESNVIISTAQKRADDFKKTTEAAAQIIGETYAHNEKAINDLTATNAQLLHDRLHSTPTRRRCDRVPKDTGTTTTGIETTPNTWELSEAAGEVFIAEAYRADQIVEDCRAMKSYIKSLHPGD